MSDFYTEDTQALMVKTWWKKYGTTLIVGTLLAILALSGHQFWLKKKEEYSAAASKLYDEYQLGLNSHDEEKMNASYNSLRENYKRTPYASAATMIEAARDVQKNNLDQASQSLTWVIDEGSSYARPIARLRLAELKLQQKDYEGAKALLKDPGDKAYVPPYQEMMGDIYFAEGKLKEAIDEYIKALEGYKELGFDNILLQYKVQSYAPNHAAGGQ